mmetsp:Transcript_44339/g.32361  ORF Transcript_44339/g.32361 Transcript_44339/m.32361 type:complete len:148 (+) Transcript_44339:632-1075(+)
MPILEAATKALDCITKNEIAVIKKLNSPVNEIRNVLTAVCILQGLQPEGKMNPTTQKKEYHYWPVAVKMMNRDDFLKSLHGYDRENIPEPIIKKLHQEILSNPDFEVAKIKNVSEVAANLAQWVVAMDKFYSVNLIVKPKKLALAEA